MFNALRVHAVLESSGIGSVSLQVIHWARANVEACPHNSDSSCAVECSMWLG